MRSQANNSLLGKYIIQVARFDPAKGIPDVIKSYAEFRRLLSLQSPSAPEEEAPQLVMSVTSSPSPPEQNTNLVCVTAVETAQSTTPTEPKSTHKPWPSSKPPTPS